MALAFLWAVSMDILRGVAIRSASGWTFAGQFHDLISSARSGVAGKNSLTVRVRGCSEWR